MLPTGTRKVQLQLLKALVSPSVGGVELLSIIDVSE